MVTVDLFGNQTVSQSRKCRVTVEADYLRIQTPYNPGFVAHIKALPAGERKFDGATKTWLVTASNYALVRDLIRADYGEDIGEMPAQVTAPKTEIKLLDLWYLGQCKPRGGDYNEAYGMSRSGDWIFAFPEPVLRDWFEGFRDAPMTAATLYGLLGAARNADLETLKSAYRRAARQWHPDVCKEPNAQDMFMQIQYAYDVLSDPGKRARYDAGLVLEATLGHNRSDVIDLFANMYRAPLRCGYVLAEGINRLGRFTVSKIMKWEDVVNEHGQVLVVSWPFGSDKPLERWS